jgi:hypothetical protein
MATVRQKVWHHDALDAGEEAGTTSASVSLSLSLSLCWRREEEKQRKGIHASSGASSVGTELAIDSE